MKYLKVRKRLLAGLCVAMLLFTACKNDDNDPSFNDDLESLTGSWNAVRVTKDDNELGEYENFTLVITEKKFFQTYGDPQGIFPVGAFEFGSNENYELVICSEIEMQLIQNGNLLKINFMRQREDINGRMQAIAGEYQFELKKE